MVHNNQVESFPSKAFTNQHHYRYANVSARHTRTGAGCRKTIAPVANPRTRELGSMLLAEDTGLEQ